MTLSKRNDWKRRLVSFRNHMIFIFQPFCIALLITAAWYQFYLRGWNFSSDDEPVLIGAIIGTLAIAFSITASTVFESTWKKYQTVVICVLKGDRNTFLYYRDERLPIIIHILLLTFTTMIIIMVGGIHYKHLVSGIVSVFSISFVLILYFIVIVELQNPAKALWFAERIPKEWLEVDIDKHFKLDRRK